MKIIINNKSYQVKIARSFKDKLIGFMFYKKKIDNIICFNNTNSIHTFFMYQPIDVIQTDNDNKIIAIYKNVKSNKIIIGNRKIKKTFELPINTAKYFKLDEYMEIID